MYRNAGRGIVDLCRDLTSEEVFVVDIATVSSRLEELFVKFVRFVPCSLFLLLIPLCRPSVIRWCIWRYSVSGAGLDHVQRWGFVSELALSKLWHENLMLLFPDGRFLLSARMPSMGILDYLTCSRFPSAFKWVFMEVSNYKSFPEVVLGLWFAIFTIATVTSFFFGLFAFPSGLVDLYFFCDLYEWTILSHLKCVFLEVFAMR